MELMPSTADSAAETVRATERERIRALVSGEVEVARQLHADDYELVTPLGFELSKEQYLGAVAAGVAGDSDKVSSRLRPTSSTNPRAVETLATVPLRSAAASSRCRRIWWLTG